MTANGTRGCFDHRVILSPSPVVLSHRDSKDRGRQNSMAKFNILKELWDFMKVRKKWWLAPILIVLILLGVLIIFTESTAVAPFIYTLF